MKTFSPVWAILVLLISLGLSAESGLILHWSLDEGTGGSVGDASGNGLAGQTAAEWVPAGKGQGLFLDGTSSKIVKVTVPENLRPGTKSWSFSAWLKPAVFKYEDRQNQRRIFSYGPYPDAFCVMDITGQGALGFYTGYKDAAGKSVNFGGGSSSLASNVWNHVVMVFDRERGVVVGYLNGNADWEQEMPSKFAQDLSKGGELTVGNGWHNYWGVVDGVSLHRRALTAPEIRDTFLSQSADYGVSTEAMARNTQAQAMEMLTQVGSNYARGDFAGGRKRLGGVLSMKGLSPQVLSLARLRMAQGFEYEKDLANAVKTYENLAADSATPGVHRAEAADSAKELKRVMEGKPARDPLATRTPVPALPTPGLEIFISPQGADANPGTVEKPLATLEAARDLARAKIATGLPKGGIRITLKSGTYDRRETLALDGRDSGTAASPIHWVAEKPGAVILYGGQTIKGFSPVTDAGLLARLPAESRGKVVQCDLKKMGIIDTGKFVPRGMSAGGAGGALIELYWDTLPQTIARWPNKGFAFIADVVVKDGNNINGFAGSKTPKFLYEGNRPERWAGEKDIWMLGYWFWDWAESQLRVESIDPATRTVTLDKAKEGYGWRKGQRYFAYNLFSEIDEPGEWMVDREAGVLYVWPPADPSRSRVELGMLPAAMVTLKGVANLRLEGIDLDLARDNAIEIEACTNILLVGCRATRFAGGGIKVTGGKGVGIHSCDLGMLGRHGIWLYGGDRPALTPSGHFVENTHIYSNSRIDPTYTPAIVANGVGMRLAHNLLHHNPSSAVRFEGNEMVIEYNETHSVVLESDDQGAMESFGNPSFRGIVLRHNYFHHIGGTATLAGQAGIRFDDAISGMVVYGNVMERSASGHFGGLQINAGRDNVMDNNLFIDCKYGISGGWNAGNKHWSRFREGGKPGGGDITNALFMNRYPAMTTMLDDAGKNFAWRNLFVESGRNFTGNKAAMETLLNGTYTNGDPGFTGRGDRRLRPDAEAVRKYGAKPIPMEEIGLYDTPWRKPFPVKPPVADIPSWRNEARVGESSIPHPMAPLSLKALAAKPVFGNGGDPLGGKGLPLVLKETPSRGSITGLPAKAWIGLHGNVIYLTVTVPVDKIKAGRTWGSCDGMEICFREIRDIADGIRSPTLVLQGFPSGEKIAAGNPDEEGFERALQAAGDGSTFRGIQGEKEWRGDWTIPLAALGITPSSGKRIQFNIGIRRTAPDDWIALAGCMGANYKVENGAVLVLE